MKGKFETALADAKKDLESNDVPRMKAALDNLQKIGAELYQQAQAAQGGAQPNAGAPEASDASEPKKAKKAEGKVVDADVEIVDEDNNKK